MESIYLSEVDILQKLYALKNSLIDSYEIDLIEKLISKRKDYFNIENSYSYTDIEISRMKIGVVKIYIEIKYKVIRENRDIIENNEDFIDYSDADYDDIENMIRCFSILKVKLKKENNESDYKIKLNGLNIIIKCEFEKLLIKIIKNHNEK
jgi:hypothetical protein